MSMKSYSAKAEREYYSSSLTDRRAIPYEHLGMYLSGSVGKSFFQGKRVLDIGCGEGVYSAWIADPACGGASNVVGYELTEHRIRRDYEKALANLSFVASDVFEMSADTNGFDVVFMNLVLHHLRFKLTETLKFVYESLKPGGRFLAFEPNVYSPMAIFLHWWRDTSKNEGFLSPKRIQLEMERVGFTEIRVGFFWRDRKWAKNPLLASSFYIVCRKPQ